MTAALLAVALHEWVVSRIRMPGADSLETNLEGASPSGKLSADVVGTPSSLEGPNEYKLEYIKAMLELVREDIRHVLLRVTAALAATALFITQIPYDRLALLPLWTRVILCVGLASIAPSGGLYFRYVRSLHIGRDGGLSYRAD